jgi:hypothetical protein
MNAEKSQLVAVGLSVALLLFLVYNFYQTTVLAGKIDALQQSIPRATSNQQAGMPAIELFILVGNCEQCEDVGRIVQSFERADINITRKTKLDYGSREASSLIQKYDIKKLPAVIVKGDIDNIEVQGFEKRQDAFVFVTESVPYLETDTGKVKGLVHVFVVTAPLCNVCGDFNSALRLLEERGVAMLPAEFVEYDSERGKQLVKDFNLSRIPALLISTEIDEYPIGQNVKQAGFSVRKQHYVVDNVVPYVEPGTGKLRGLVEVTMLVDNNCTECYDVNMHIQILKGFGLFISRQDTVDISSEEGQALLGKYNITKIPTIIITGDMEPYASFDEVWAQVGTVESDGAYVFRNMEALGDANYVDLNNIKLS